MFICTETEKQIKQFVPRDVARFVQPNTVHVFTHHFAEVHYFIWAYTPFSHNILQKYKILGPWACNYLQKQGA